MALTSLPSLWGKIKSYLGTLLPSVWALGGKEGTAAPPRKGPRDSRASGTCRPGGAAEPLPGQGPVSKERGALQPAEVPFTPVVAGLRHKWDTVISFALPGLPLQHAHTHRHTCRGNPQEGSGG